MDKTDQQDEAETVGVGTIGGAKSDEQNTTHHPSAVKVRVKDGANPQLLMYQAPRKVQGSKALLPLRKPSEDADPAVWAAYRAERQRRRVIKRERRGRIARRESPHDTMTCEFCTSVSKREESDRSVAEIARRSLVSPSTVYRVLQQSYGKGKVRGHRTLRTLRRIAHDGMGISLDELAATILD